MFVRTCNTYTDICILNVCSLGKHETKAPPISGIVLYVEKLYEKNAKDTKVLKENLERYLLELTKTAETLELYKDDAKKQKQSRLWKEVNLGFMACELWMKAIEKEKVPRELEKSLKRKTGRLQVYITLEANEQLGEAQASFDQLLEDAKNTPDALKHPYVFYHQGKEYFANCQWYEAKQEFLKYAKLLEAGDNRCKKPSEDNCYYYLSYIEEQMNIQKLTSPDPTLSCVIVPDRRSNEYEKKYQKWIVDHPPSDSAVFSRGRPSSTPKKEEKTKSPPTTPMRVDVPTGGSKLSDLISPTAEHPPVWLTYKKEKQTQSPS